MSKVLVIAEHLDGKLNAATAKTVSAALALKPDSIGIAVLAADPANAEASSFEVADIGVAGNLFKLLPELEAAL